MQCWYSVVAMFMQYIAILCLPSFVNRKHYLKNVNSLLVSIIVSLCG